MKKKTTNSLGHIFENPSLQKNAQLFNLKSNWVNNSSTSNRIFRKSERNHKKKTRSPKETRYNFKCSTPVVGKRKHFKYLDTYLKMSEVSSFWWLTDVILICRSENIIWPDKSLGQGHGHRPAGSCQTHTLMKPTPGPSAKYLPNDIWSWLILKFPLPQAQNVTTKKVNGTRN